MQTEAINSLQNAGLSNLEAAIYIRLLETPDLTGYRLSHLLGKPIANIYRALNSLNKKGAIVTDERAGGKVHSALPIGEYFDVLERNLLLRRQDAEKKLQDIETVYPMGGIYQLSNVDQIHTKVENMIENCEEVMLIDASPAQLEKMKALIEDAFSRGVRVFVKTYGNIEINGCEIVRPHEDDPPARIVFDWFIIVIDGTEYLTSVIGKDDAEIRHAVWSRDNMMSLIIYNGLMNELMFTRLSHMANSGTSSIRMIKKISEMKNELAFDRSSFSRYFEG